MELDPHQTHNCSITELTVWAFDETVIDVMMSFMDLVPTRRIYKVLAGIDQELLFLQLVYNTNSDSSP